MDDRRFDSLTRALSSEASRRKTLGALAGSVAGALALIGVETEAGHRRRRRDRCKDLGRRCDTGGDCCGRRKTACDRISRSCRSSPTGERCCRTQSAPCNSSCDCCDPFVCFGGQCVQPS